MRNCFKKNILILFLLLTAAMISGCSDEEKSVVTEKKDSFAETEQYIKKETKADNELNIVCSETNIKNVYELIDFYCNEKNIDKEQFNVIVSKDEYAVDVNESDMIFLDNEHAVTYVNNDYLSLKTAEDLEINKNELSEIYSGLLNIGRDDDTSLRAFPVYIEPVVFCYREDLAYDYFGYETEEEMQEAVEDWNSFRYTARTIYEDSDNRIKICTLNELKENCININNTSFLENDKLIISDKMLDLYEYIKEFSKEGYASQNIAGDAQWEKELKNDEIFGFFADFYDENQNLTNKMADDEYIRWNQSWKCIKGPECLIKNGMWISVPEKSVHDEMTSDFIRFYTQNKDMIKKYALKHHRYMSNRKVMDSIIENEENESVSWISRQNEHRELDEVLSVFEPVGNRTRYNLYLLNKFKASVELFTDGIYTIAEDAADGFRIMSEKKLAESGIITEY